MDSPHFVAHIAANSDACLLILVLAGSFLSMAVWTGCSAPETDGTDITEAVVVVRSGDVPKAESTAADVLVEEVEKRTGVRWRVTTEMPSAGVAISIESRAGEVSADADAPPEMRPEGFHLSILRPAPGLVHVRILGADGRGALFGVGRLLTMMLWGKRSVRVPEAFDIRTAPAYPLRGHQLGYVNLNNTCDAWDDDAYEQYIRELVIFGTNAIENAPLPSSEPCPHMRLSQEEMNIRLSEICDRYDIDYCFFAPVHPDLNDTVARANLVRTYEELARACPRLDHVLFPGGDPGHNHPRLLLPFVKDAAEAIRRHHPEVGIWVSLQVFNREKTDYFFRYIEEHSPDWLTGVAHGPQSPLLPVTRERLPKKYRIRHYPDITHTVRCQYPVVWWDPAFNATLGREPVNPQPVYYALIHNWAAPYTEGFIAYSEGVNDDVNKVVWSVRGWDPNAEVREILRDYTRLFFSPEVADRAADGILALERNWEGPLAQNGGVDATHALWQSLEKEAPQLVDSWRWQALLLRAYFDVYVRHRLIYETALEDEANRALAAAPEVGASSAIARAEAILAQTTTHPIRTEWRETIVGLCKTLFTSIGFQTDVERYGAAGPERGAVLDFLDHPLNNRWWLEDELGKASALPTEAERVRALERLRTWEHPEPGSFYDDVGNVAKSPHVVRGEGLNTDPLMQRNPNVGFWWWQDGKTRARPSWISSMWPWHDQTGWPIALVYERLDPAAEYLVRLTGVGEALLRVNGERVEPTLYGTEIGEFKEFPVPHHLVRGGALRLTFDIPDEENVNWRQRSRVNEIWLIKR